MIRCYESTVFLIYLCRSVLHFSCFLFFFSKQKTAYEMRIRDWSSDVCSSELNLGKPQIRIKVDRAEMARHGMNAETVLTMVRNGLGGEPVSVLLDGVKRFDIAVRLDDATRESVEDL